MSIYQSPSLRGPRPPWYSQACFQKIKTNMFQIRTLEELRDTLLPKLMSGEVRVPPISLP